MLTNSNSSWQFVDPYSFLLGFGLSKPFDSALTKVCLVTYWAALKPAKVVVMLIWGRILETRSPIRRQRKKWERCWDWDWLSNWIDKWRRPKWFEIRDNEEIQADLISGETQRHQKDQEKGKVICSPRYGMAMCLTIHHSKLGAENLASANLNLPKMHPGEVWIQGNWWAC